MVEPTDPTGAPPFQPNAGYWQGHAAHAPRPPRRGLSPTAAVAIAVGCGVAAFGAYAVFAGVGGPSAGDVESAVTKALAAATCPNPGGAVTAQILLSPYGVDLFAPGVAAGTAGCLRTALGGVKTGDVDPNTLVQSTLQIQFDGEGTPSLVGSPPVHRLDAAWRVGVVGDDLSGKRGRLETILEAGKPDLMACYADGAIRAVGKLPARSWHTEDEVLVRLRIEPDGAIAGIEVARPGVVYVADWSSTPRFINCVRRALHTLNWPAHRGAQWNWVNTTFEVSQTQL